MRSLFLSFPAFLTSCLSPAGQPALSEPVPEFDVAYEEVANRQIPSAILMDRGSGVIAYADRRDGKEVGLLGFDFWQSCGTSTEVCFHREFSSAPMVGSESSKIVAEFAVVEEFIGAPEGCRVFRTTKKNAPATYTVATSCVGYGIINAVFYVDGEVRSHIVLKSYFGAGAIPSLIKPTDYDGTEATKQPRR